MRGPALRKRKSRSAVDRTVRVLHARIEEAKTEEKKVEEQLTGEQLNEKFATTAKFQMTYGSLSLFYGGLESLLGPPKMYKGANHAEKSLFNTMEFEHLLGPDAKDDFTGNTGATTTSEPSGGRRCVSARAHTACTPRNAARTPCTPR